MACPTFDNLMDFLDGRLSEQPSNEIRSHLDSGCLRCSEDRRWYTRALEVSAGDDSVAPPAWVLKRAQRVLEDAYARPTVVEKIAQAAILILDSLRQPSLAQARSATLDSRQLLYQAGEYSIDLRVEPASGSTALVVGQVLKERQLRFESVAGLSLQLHAAGNSYSTTTSDLGQFRFDDVTTGSYRLLLKTSDFEVTIDNVPIELQGDK